MTTFCQDGKSSLYHNNPPILRSFLNHFDYNKYFSSRRVPFLFLSLKEGLQRLILIDKGQSLHQSLEKYK